MPDNHIECDLEQALLNVAALAQFADPRKLPPYPRDRRTPLLWAAWRAFWISAHRPWPEA